MADHEAEPNLGIGAALNPTCRHCQQPIVLDGETWVHVEEPSE